MDRTEISKYDTFVVPPGIGDFAWIYMKLCNLPYPVNIEISSPTDQSGTPQLRRCSPFLELLPKIKSHRYLDYPVWLDDDYRELDYGRCWIQANLHLENGNRIEDFLPELETALHFEMRLPEIKDSDRGKIILYTASLKANLNWQGWDFEDWYELLALCGNREFVFVGAEWDRDYLNFFEQFPFNNLVEMRINHPLAEIFALIKNAKCLIGFPSGISILSRILDTPTVMFYPRHLEKMMYAWDDPESRERYYPAIYGEEEAKPTRVYEWIKQWI
jgi:hypothetical protein